MTRSSLYVCLWVLTVTPTANGADPPAIADITWRLGPNLPEFRKGGCATVIDGRLISVFGMRQPWGEMNTMYVFDPSSNTWTRSANAPIGQTYVQGTELASAKPADVFYAIGGRSREHGGVHRLCFRLNGEGGVYRWNAVANLNQRRAWAPSASLGTKLYVFGGALGGHGPTLSSVEVLDTAAHDPEWQTLTDIPGASRGWCGAAAVGGKLYVLGGSHFFDPRPTEGPDRRRLDELWTLNPDTLEWHTRARLPYRVSGFDCCVYADRYIILVGGAAEAADYSYQMREIIARDRFAASYYSPFVLVYDTQADEWRRLESVMPVATNDTRVVLTGTTLYALGGENIEPATSNTTPWLRIGQIVAGE